jgi:mono/diheme cytochrome c family protein
MPRSFPTPPALTAALATLAGLAGCAGSRAIPEPTAIHLERAEALGFPSPTLESLRHGRKLYISRCSNCHTLYAPADYTPESWPAIVEDMRDNAEIDEAQVRDITRYVAAVSAAARDTSSARPTDLPPTDTPPPSP